MSRKKRFKGHAEKREGHYYTALPHVVLWSLEFASLSASATKLLFDLLAQYKGGNNGNLCAAWSVMMVGGKLPGNKDWHGRNWRSRETLQKALRELIEAGFIVVTRKGMSGSEAKGKSRVATLYGVTFYEIDWCDGKLDIKAPTRAFMGAWHRQENAQSVTRPAGQSSADWHAQRVNSRPGAPDSHGRRVIQGPFPATIDTPGVSPSRGSTPSRGSAEREPAATDPLPWEPNRTRPASPPASRPDRAVPLELQARPEGAPHPGDRTGARPAPAAHAGNGKQGSEAAAATPARPADSPAPAPQAKPADNPPMPHPPADGALSEQETERFVALLTADGSTTEHGARVIVRWADDADIRHVLQEAERRGLVGEAVRALMDERRAIAAAKRSGKFRLAQELAKRMGKHLGLHESSDVVKERARGLEHLRESHGLSRDQIWAEFERLSGDERLRSQILIPAVLHYYMQQREPARAE